MYVVQNMYQFNLFKVSSFECRGRVFFTGPPPKNLKYKKVDLGVSRPIYVNVDSPNLGFPYFSFRGEPVKKITLYVHQFHCVDIA